ncbi:putative YphP/YqiW family bacilliredoxin [Scopulibacillus darangshiensis]|uniref:Putative YphP/YqiW family bacilliredoxin n=1 Tax=Scopulibacillus darangshiensis TaxID=442528 RepID=A0A4R2NY94_9BACL|nr:BrxA/BrxB family bacilliredoxin [Scopulibacillus darangshiensis]TCP27052.1 putative YphP/YqiW family bacilliredoxin [Scopulibacillus darangshiensis]
MSMAYEEYMKQVAKPMREELTSAGFSELLTPEDVDAYMEKAEGTTLVVVNSVCGCAAGLARPAVNESLKGDVIPDHLVTVFAGQDREATAAMRDYFKGYEPSSPSIALLSGKDVVHFIPREDIEDEDLENIARALKAAYNSHCKNQA